MSVRIEFANDKKEKEFIIMDMLKVRIYQPARSSMTSGLAKTRQWVLEYEPVTKRTPEPLMGWSQSMDTYNQIRLKFPTKQAAIAHAEKQGWNYVVQVDKTKIVKPRSYMDNFKYIPASDDAAK